MLLLVLYIYIPIVAMVVCQRQRNWIRGIELLRWNIKYSCNGIHAFRAKPFTILPQAVRILLHTKLVGHVRLRIITPLPDVLDLLANTQHVHGYRVLVVAKVSVRLDKLSRLSLALSTVLPTSLAIPLNEGWGQNQKNEIRADDD